MILRSISVCLRVTDAHLKNSKIPAFHYSKRQFVSRISPLTATFPSRLLLASPIRVSSRETAMSDKESCQCRRRCVDHEKKEKKRNSFNAKTKIHTQDALPFLPLPAPWKSHAPQIAVACASGVYLCENRIYDDGS